MTLLLNALPFQATFADDTVMVPTSETSSISTVDSSEEMVSSETTVGENVTSSPTEESETTEESLSEAESSNDFDTTSEESTTEDSKSNESEESSTLLKTRQVVTKYATIQSEFNLYDNKLSQIIGTTKDYIGKTLKVKGELEKNGKSYYQLETNKNVQIGFVESSKIKISDNAGGNYHSYGKYVTIKVKNYDIWQNFNWKKRSHSSNYYGKVLEARGYYTHFNGSRYLSLYDNKGIWIGYMNESGTQISNNKAGLYQSNEKYVTVKVKNYDIWGNFNWKKRNHSSDYYGKVLQARGYYENYNGSRYLSLYDNKGTWIGYMNEKGTQKTNNKAGLYQSYGKYITIKVKNYNIWQNFNWKKRNYSSDYYGKVLQARGFYENYNGSRYLSLYDNKGTWVGYINENGTNISNNKAGLYQKYGKEVVITVKNYDIWQNFNWKKKNHSSKYYGQKLLAKGYYENYNSSRYLSLYDSKGTWIGYMNEKGTRLANGNIHMFVMGHGAGDPGAIGAGTNEATFTRNELMPYLQKYAKKLKYSEIVFYDPSHDMYQDTKKKKGAHTVSGDLASVTEIHLDSGPTGATGGHVIVNKTNGVNKENLALAQTIKQYNSMWSGVSLTKGLSIRNDLLNLNTFEKRNIPYRLIELGFISNSNDVAKLRKNKDALAKSIIMNVTGEIVY